jgi:myo-inositol 2-dehydrogenase/D-chiro-inositol 1-dehydrogenase
MVVFSSRERFMNAPTNCIGLLLHSRLGFGRLDFVRILDVGFSALHEETSAMVEPSTRRTFVGLAAGAGIAGAMAHSWHAARAEPSQSKNDRLRIGCIGVGWRGTGISGSARSFGDIVAVCDTDLAHAEKFNMGLGGKAEVYQDYRKFLDRNDLDVIINGTPDHWHTIINVAACRSGRDVYTEKPLTLTIDEGKVLRKVVHETRRIVQVGTQQRSDRRFRTVCELVRNGRIGKLKQVVVMLPFWKARGGPFKPQTPPTTLNWDLWQGQAPERPFCRERFHGSFRWWSDYAGGIITDWGQHHMDIAYWGMDMDRSGPLEVEGRAFFPNRGRPDCYDNPDRFVVRMKFPGDIGLLYLVVRDAAYRKSMAAGDITEVEDADLFAGVPEEWKQEQRDGILFIGDTGQVFVNRGGAYGKAVEELKAHPLPADAVQLYESRDHMRNFFDCVKSRKQPISPVDVGHRVITACHLSNIAMRLKRKIVWDPVHEEIVGDAEACNSMYVRRDQRAPYRVQG